MEQFEPKYEAQKIPEFYQFYFNYQTIKAEIARNKNNIKRKSDYLDEIFSGMRKEVARFLYSRQKRLSHLDLTRNQLQVQRKERSYAVEEHSLR